MIKKIPIFLCLALCCLICFGGSADAASFDFGGYTADVAEHISAPHAYAIYKDTAGDTRLFVAGYFTGYTGLEITPPYVKFTTNNPISSLNVNFIYDSRSAHYILQDNAWVLVGDPYNMHNKGSGVAINTAVVSFVESSYPITLSDGTVVFQGPPVKPQTLEEIMWEETEKLQAKTITTMGVLTACGIGLLALLIGLNLLPKVLYRFL